MISCARCYHVLRYMSAINDIFIRPISTVMRLAMISYDYEVQRTSSFLKQVCMGQKVVSSLDGHAIVAYCLFQQATKLVGNQRKSCQDTSSKQEDPWQFIARNFNPGFLNKHICMEKVTHKHN